MLPLEPCSHSKIDIPLNIDGLCRRPIDAMPMRLNVKTEPVPLSSTSIQLGSICIMHPNNLAKMLYPCQVGRAPIQCLPGRHSPKRTCGCSVLQPRCMAQSLPPHVSREMRCVQQHADLLKQRLVEALCDTVQLQRVMDGESAHGSCISKVFAKLLAQVLAATIQSQDFDHSAVALGECPSLKPLIEGKCVALYREEVHEGVAGRIVSECDEVSVTTKSSNSGWTANIGVYFITILLGLGTDLDLWYRLPRCTCIKTRLAVLFP